MNDYSVAIKGVEEFFFTWRKFQDIKLSENEKYDPCCIKIHLYTQTIKKEKIIL